MGRGLSEPESREPISNPGGPKTANSGSMILTQSSRARSTMTEPRCEAWRCLSWRDTSYGLQAHSTSYIYKQPARSDTPQLGFLCQYRLSHQGEVYQPRATVASCTLQCSSDALPATSHKPQAIHAKCNTPKAIGYKYKSWHGYI